MLGRVHYIVNQNGIPNQLRNQTPLESRGHHDQSRRVAASSVVVG